VRHILVYHVGIINFILLPNKMSFLNVKMGLGGKESLIRKLDCISFLMQTVRVIKVKNWSFLKRL
jgi:hypothetical protein